MQLNTFNLQSYGTHQTSRQGSSISSSSRTNSVDLTSTLNNSTNAVVLSPRFGMLGFLKNLANALCDDSITRENRALNGGRNPNNGYSDVVKSFGGNPNDENDVKQVQRLLIPDRKYNGQAIKDNAEDTRVSLVRSDNANAANRVQSGLSDRLAKLKQGNPKQRRQAEKIEQAFGEGRYEVQEGYRPKGRTNSFGDDLGRVEQDIKTVEGLGKKREKPEHFRRI